MMQFSAPSCVGLPLAIAGERDDIRNLRGGSQRDVLLHLLRQLGMVLFAIPAVGNCPGAGGHRRDQPIFTGDRPFFVADQIDAAQPECGALLAELVEASCSCSTICRPTASAVPSGRPLREQA